MNPLTKIKKMFDSTHNYILFRYRKLSDFKKVDIRGNILICGCRHPNIVFGDNVIINSSVRSNPSGGVTARTMFTVYEDSKLTIGNNTGISNSTIVCRESVTIGDNVNIGVNNVIYDTDMHSVDYRDRMDIPDKYIKNAPVIIDEGTWICGHCIILKGVHIGKRSVVAAGSVVTCDIPDDELWGGNPCRFIRKINQNLGQNS